MRRTNPRLPGRFGVNKGFATAIGWPHLDNDNQPVMIAIAVGTVVATAWEIAKGFRRALRTSQKSPVLDTAGDPA